MAARPPKSAEGAALESRIDSGWLEAAVGTQARQRPHRPADHARRLLLLGLLGAAVVVLWLRLLAGTPHLPLTWHLAGDGAITLGASSDPALQSAIGHRLQALVPADGERLEASAALLPRSPRWIVDDGERQQHQALRTRIGEVVQQPQVLLQFHHDLQLTLAPRPRGLAGLGALCWAVCALALALYLAAAVVLLAQPGLPAVLYGVLALSQCLNLLLIGADSLQGMGLPAALVRGDLALRLLAAAVAGAALVHVLLLYPQRLAGARWRAALVWALVGGVLVWMLSTPPAGLWWWAQGLGIACGLTAAAQLRQRQDQPVNPLARLLQRLVLAGVGTLLLLNLAIAAAGRDGTVQYQVATIGSIIWVVFFASLLMLGPFLSRSRQVLREFMLLAGVATVVTSLDLLSLAILGLQPLTSLALAVGLSLAVYALARPWIHGQLAGSGALSAERMFDSLYRAARELEQSPGQAGRQLSALLCEVFDPLQAAPTARAVSRVRVAADGATMVVPIPRLAGTEPGAIVLRHARRGRRLFTQQDRELCEQLLEQLRRAVAYDRAVEHGRTEERTRIAQDLHDDIGARLLTLMYKAPNAEIEEYIRHTLQDLKTLTRGLAASSHRLSHAAAEWKADITQRLSAAGCDLHWSFSADRDLTLTVVQWSALTRVLRELVNNILTHAQATQVEIVLQFDRDHLTLSVSDDGNGRAPETWSHGLGLGGVRKRVKLLGGQVRWVEREGRGIRCEVQAPLSGDTP
ncbi:MAG: ATP-binding protein [Aquabacterium sp.]|nr:ATP-binding protein [Aquabacterium sp.]